MGGGPRPRTASKARRHEDHVGLSEQFDQPLGVLESGLPADVGVGSRAPAVREPRSDLQLHLRLRDTQCLLVGVDGLESNPPPRRLRSCD